MKRKVISFVLAAGMMLSLAACGGGSDNAATSGAATSGAATSTAATSGATDTKPTGAAFKIGGTAPLTGAAAIYGNAAKNGAAIAVEEINAAGGDIQFDLRYEDDVNDPEKAINAYNTLKDWGMQISLGSVTTKPCEATSTETYSDRIFALTPSASSKAVIEGKDNQYQMCFMDPNQGSASAQYISEKKLGTKIAIIWKNDDVYSKGIYQTFTEKAKELKLEIVSETTFADGNDTDFSVQITDAKDKGADLIFLPMYYQPASLILAQASSMGYEPKFFGVDGMDGILTQEGFDKKLAEGVMLLTPFNADSKDEKTQAFREEVSGQVRRSPQPVRSRRLRLHLCLQAGSGSGKGYPRHERQRPVRRHDQAVLHHDLRRPDRRRHEVGHSGAVSKEPKGMEIENGAYVGLD